MEDIANKGRDYYMKNAGLTPEERAIRQAALDAERKLYAENNDPQRNKMDRLWATLAAAGGHGNIGYMGRDMVSTSDRVQAAQNRRAEEGLAALNKLYRDTIGDVDIADRRSAADKGLGFYEKRIEEALSRDRTDVQRQQVNAQFQANQIAKLSGQFSIASEKSAKLIEAMNEIRDAQGTMGSTSGLTLKLNGLIDQISEADREDLPRLTQNANDIRAEIQYQLEQIPEYTALSKQLERMNAHVDNLANELASL